MPTASDTPAAPLRLRLFGRPALEAAGSERLPLPRERRYQLVVRLAMARDWAGRDELAALLWPELPQRLALANLRKALHRLQGTPWDQRVEVRGSTLRLRVDSDLAAFDEALAGGHPEAAVALREAELLSGFDDDANGAWSDWLRQERTRWHAAWRAAALAALEQPALAGESAIGISGALLAADPLDEAALAAHMHALAAHGQAGAAREAWRAFAERLRAELGVEPGAALKALHDRLDIGAGRATPPPRPSATGPLAAAAPDDRFVGRTQELQHIAQTLARPDCGLLCLVGPGGVGKTTLARRVLQALAADFADGTLFLALEEVRSAAEAASRLAAELGLKLPGRGNAAAELAQALARLRMLIVLDNADALAADSGWLDTLATAGPGLKLLLTSRLRPVGAAAWVLPLTGLPCPEPDDADLLESFDAARLFVAAAQRIEPALVPSAEAGAIVEICRLVDGLPLALELIAGWTRVLSCQAIVKALQAGPELLRATDPSRPPRQASLQGVFDQSWRQLSEAERAALARLSVFRGGFEPEAALAVAGAAPAMLAALCDHSLLRKEAARCTLHPLVQAFAAERLGRGAALDRAERAHALFHGRLVQRLHEPMLRGDRDALRRLDAELDNLRAAWRHAVARGGPAMTARFAPALCDYCDRRGRAALGLALIREAAPGAPPGAEGAGSADALARATLGAATAYLEFRLDRYASAEALARESLSVAYRARTRRWAGPATALAADETRHIAHCVVAGCCQRTGRVEEAARWYRRALVLGRLRVDTRRRAATLDNLALLERMQGHLDAALQLSLRALADFRTLGDIAGEALCRNNLGVLQMARGDVAAACQELDAAFSLADRHGLAWTRARALVNLADAHGRHGDAQAAARYAGLAIEAGETMRDGLLATVSRLIAARLAARRVDLQAARQFLRQGAESAVQLGSVRFQLAAVAIFGELLAAMGEREIAIPVVARVAQAPSLEPADREELQELLAGWGVHGAVAHVAAPELALDDLARRIVAETDQGWRQLIAELRA